MNDIDETKASHLLVVRSEDLVITEIIVLLSFTFFFICLFRKHGFFVIPEGIGMFITPLLYTILWRHKSIKYDLSSEKEELQSGLTIITSFLGLLQNTALIFLGIGGIRDDIYLGGFSLIFGVSSSFYILKTFIKSYRIDHQSKELK